MAKSKANNPVLLGYEDEMISEKHKTILGYWSNKVGGRADWPFKGVMPPKCKLCSFHQILIVQIYAPLENSLFHRTLYVFACINPNCWNHSESWTCLRCQLLDSEMSTASEKVSMIKTTDWCAGADDWNDSNGNYENESTTKVVNQYNLSDFESDDDSSSLSAMLNNMNVDEYNANFNNSEKNFGAVGKPSLPSATAEIEKEESEVVCIDTPTMPQKDLLALLQEATPFPYYLRANERNQNDSITFVPFFISVAEEGIFSSNSEHIRDLIQEYKKNHGEIPQLGSVNENVEKKKDFGTEEYEIAVPPHGDRMFYQFMNKIQKNPGQILRYCRESEFPLLLYPLHEYPTKCTHCSGEVVFEMQILPTLIPKLKFPNEDEIRVEFGNVLVFTCKQSCWSLDDNFREEIIIVQAEA